MLTEAQKIVLSVGMFRRFDGFLARMLFLIEERTKKVKEGGASLFMSE
jgi:hypothetical protein